MIRQNHSQTSPKPKSVGKSENTHFPTSKPAPSVHCIVGRKQHEKIDFFEKLKPIETYKNEIKHLFLLYENNALYEWVKRVETANNGVLSYMYEAHKKGFSELLCSDERKRFFRLVNAVTLINKAFRVQMNEYIFVSTLQDFNMAIEIYEYNRSLKVKYNQHLRLIYDLAKLCFEQDFFTKLMLVDLLDFPFNYVHELTLLLEKQGKFISENRNENQEKLYRVVA